MQGFNIFFRKDGRFEGRIPIGKNEKGNRNFKYFYGKTKEQVIEKISIFHSIKKPANVDMTFSNLYTEWYQVLSHRVKETTMANYETKGCKHILPEFGEKNVAEITTNDIYAFIDKKEAEGLSYRYRQDIIIVVKSIFKYGVKVYKINNPAEHVTIGKRKTPEIKLLDDKEQKKLEDYVADNHNRTTLGVALTMTTGLRIGELCGLQWEDIDLENRTLKVNKTVQRIRTPKENKKTKIIITEPKSESSKRIIPLNKNIIDFLKDFKGDGKEYLLSGKDEPTEPRTLQYRFKTMLKKLNLPDIHFHALRHMFATNCVSIGFDVKALSEMLGHSGVEITLNRYVHSSLNRKREYMDRLDFAF